MRGDAVDLLLKHLARSLEYEFPEGGALHRLAQSLDPLAPAAANALLAAGMDVNDDVNDPCLTPLHIAARHSADMVDTFLAAGASVTALSGHDGTPLHEVDGPDAADIVRLLVASGASLTATDAFGRTPLLAVAGSSSSHSICHCLEALLAAGADVHATDNDGMGVLHLFALCPPYDYLEAVDLLVRAGADVKATCNAGLQPAHYAVNPCGKRFGRYYGDWADGNFGPITELDGNGADLLAPSPLGSPLALALSTYAGDTRNREVIVSVMIECIAETDLSLASDVLRAVHLVPTPLEPWFFSAFLSSFSTVLTEAHWFALSCLVRGPVPGVGRFLPTALACSSRTARDFLRFFLFPADAERLRTFALCLNRLQRTPQLSVDTSQRILKLSLSDV
jgi:ankyrin repeat protein